ncbi:MAG: peptidylprolyl isomerase [Burkholderiales bacterium]|nr:peptidylprolyl isomerase [Burkholderiales bacterium]
MSVTVNGVVVAAAEDPAAAAAAARELLRQRAVAEGLAPPDAAGAQADAAIERLLEREVTVPRAGEDECRRYYDAHPGEFTAGELVFARHILFQVGPGSPVPAIRAKAESTLAELMRDGSRFGDRAREYSNCPSGRHDGNLGQLGRGDTVPEFEQALFNGGYTGIYPQLVKTRHGFHVLAVDRREPGRRIPFEAAREAIALRLRERVMQRALRQYVSVLAGQAEVSGVDLEAAATPLVR